MRIVGRTFIAILATICQLQTVLASSEVGEDDVSQRSVAGRVAEGIGGAASAYAGYALASSGCAGVAGAIGTATTALANGGVAAGVMGAVGASAGLVVLGGTLALVGVHCITDAMGLWTFDDSKRLLKKLFGKKPAESPVESHDNWELLSMDDLQPLPPVGSVEDDWRKGQSSKEPKKMKAESEEGANEKASGDGVQALSDSSVDSGSLRERIAKRREERKKLRSLDFDAGEQDLCKCEEPGCTVEERRENGKIAATVVFGCSKCGKTNQEYAMLAIKWEKKMLRQGLDVQWIGVNAEANARKAAGAGGEK